MVKNEYRRHRRRIQQFIRRAQQRGYQFPSDILPNIPKTITQGSVNRLARLTPDVLYSKAKYGGELSYGEIVTGKKGRKLEKEHRKNTRHFKKQGYDFTNLRATDYNAVDRVTELINHSSKKGYLSKYSDQQKIYFQAIIKENTDEMGKSEYARYLKSNETAINKAVNEIMRESDDYKSAQLEREIAGLLSPTPLSLEQQKNYEDSIEESFSNVEEMMTPWGLAKDTF